MKRSEVITGPVWVEFVNLDKLLVFEVEVKRQHVNTGAPTWYLHGPYTDRLTLETLEELVRACTSAIHLEGYGYTFAMIHARLQWKRLKFCEEMVMRSGPGFAIVADICFLISVKPGIPISSRHRTRHSRLTGWHHHHPQSSVRKVQESPFGTACPSRLPQTIHGRKCPKSPLSSFHIVSTGLQLVDSSTTPWPGRQSTLGIELFQQ